MATERQRQIARLLSATLPRVPYIDAEAIRGHAASRHMRDLGPGAAVWLAIVSHIRHAHTEYDALRDEGYDRDEARFFVLDETNAVLDAWGSSRQLTSQPDLDPDLDAQP